jgi:hypothetical protein
MTRFALLNNGFGFSRIEGNASQSGPMTCRGYCVLFARQARLGKQFMIFDQTSHFTSYIFERRCDSKILLGDFSIF